MALRMFHLTIPIRLCGQLAPQTAEDVFGRKSPPDNRLRFTTRDAAWFA